MDLFDCGTYFASYAPVKALTHPLLKNAACALAAKQLGCAKGAKAIVGGVTSVQARMERWPGVQNADWFYFAAKYYDRTIQLLMEVLQDVERTRDIAYINGRYRPGTSAAEIIAANVPDRDLQPTSAKSEEVLAATAILCVYEFLDASGPAWNRHLSGAKSLLEVARSNMLPSTHQLYFTHQQTASSTQRQAIFWNFARQDYLFAC